MTKFPKPLMLCLLILFISDGTYSLKTTLNKKIFSETFHCICQKPAERNLQKKKYLSHFELIEMSELTIIEYFHLKL